MKAKGDSLQEEENKKRVRWEETKDETNSAEKKQKTDSSQRMNERALRKEEALYERCEAFIANAQYDMLKKELEQIAERAPLFLNSREKCGENHKKLAHIRKKIVSRLLTVKEFSLFKYTCTTGNTEALRLIVNISEKEDIYKSVTHDKLSTFRLFIMGQRVTEIKGTFSEAECIEGCKIFLRTNINPTLFQSAIDTSCFAKESFKKAFSIALEQMKEESIKKGNNACLVDEYNESKEGSRQASTAEKSVSQATQSLVSEKSKQSPPLFIEKLLHQHTQGSERQV